MIDPETAKVLRRLADILDWTLTEIGNLGTETIPVSEFRGYQRELGWIISELGLVSATSHHVHRIATSAFIAGRYVYTCACGATTGDADRAESWRTP
jgi:hypothetical protein